jgi:hypothetical protein
MRPPGVSADHWVPLGPEVGIVIVAEHPVPPPAIGSPRLPGIEGYVAVRRSGTWWRLQSLGGGGIVPLAAAADFARSAPERPMPDGRSW